jgi:TfoX/Sxy family transcriptional regulator of competence genes
MAYDEELAARIRRTVAGEHDLTEKKMFGGLAFLIGGRMSVAAASRGGLMLRVDPDQTDDLLAEQGAEPFVMRGRPMNGWLLVDSSGIATDEDLSRWVAIGVAYARSLPPN